MVLSPLKAVLFPRFIYFEISIRIYSLEYADEERVRIDFYRVDEFELREKGG
jgi:hypothetical protein